MKTLLCLAIATISCASDAQSTITSWDFNTLDNSGDTGTLSPSFGSGVVAGVGGVGLGFEGVQTSSDPVAWPDDSGLVVFGYPPQGQASGSCGVMFSFSTVGYKDIHIQFDERHDHNASLWSEVLVTTNGGASWLSALTYAFPPNEGFARPYRNGRHLDLSWLAAANDNPLFGFKIVAVLRPGANYYDSSRPGTFYGGGDIAYDMVQGSGTQLVPEPAYALAIWLGLWIVRRRNG